VAGVESKSSEDQASSIETSLSITYFAMKVWLVSLLVVAALLTTTEFFTILLGVTVGVGGSDTQISYRTIIDGVQSDVQSAIDRILQPMVLAAMTLAQVDPTIRDCTLVTGSQGAYDPSILIALQNAYGVSLDTTLQSVGVISAAKFSNNGTENDANKESWELARGFGCPEYIYAYTDVSLGFYGYCAWSNYTLDYSYLAYNGSDYGLTQEERSLMRGDVPALFLKIFNLLGHFSLTYERSYRCAQAAIPAYALTFAEKGLDQLDMSMQQISPTVRAFVVEAASGLLVTTSVLGQTIILSTDNQTATRVSAVNATDRMIREAAQYVLMLEDSFTNIATSTEYENDASGTVIDARPYSYAPALAPLAWVQVTVVLKSDIVTTSQLRQSVLLTEVLTALVVGFIALIVLALLMISCFRWVGLKDMSDAKQRLMSNGDA